MPTRQEIINKTKQADPSFAGMSDNEIIDLVQQAQPDLLIEEDQGLLEGGVADFGGAVLGGVDNLLTDITNLTVGKVLGKEFDPIRDLPEGEEYKGGLLRRTTGRLGEFGKQTFAGAEAKVRGEQSQIESVYQMGGELAKFATGTFGDIIGSGLSTVAPDNLEKRVGELVQEGLTETETGQFLVKQMTEFEDNMKYLEKNDPQAYRNYRATFGYLEAGAEAVGLKKVSGLYRVGGEIKHIPVDKLKELTQQTTAKLQEAVQQTGDIMRKTKDSTFEKFKDLSDNLPKPSKEYQKAVSTAGTEFEVDKTPTLFENFNDITFGKQNQEMAVQSIFPKATKEKGISARLKGGETALKGVEQLYDDRARGIVSADINEMAGGVEGVQQGLEYWGKKIGEFTDVDTTVNFSKEIDTLAKSLDEKFAKLNPEMYNRAKFIVDEFRNVGNEASIKDLQKAISDIKSDVFSDFKVTKQLASSSTGKALGNLLDSLTDKFNATIDMVTGNSKQLKEAKNKYSNYLKIQKDLTDSYLVAQRNAGKGLSGTAGKLGGAYEVMNNPSVSGVIKGLLLKQSGELISKAKSRDGNWEMLIRNLDRKAVRDYNLKKDYVQKSEDLANNSGIDSDKLDISNRVSDVDSDMDIKKPLISESESLEIAQDTLKYIEESIGDKEALMGIKEGLKTFDLPKKYQDILDEKLDAHIRDVDTYQKEVDLGLKDSFSLTEHYGDDLTKAFNRLEGIQARTKTTKGGDKMSTIEFETSPAYKTFSDNAQEYINQRNFDDLTVQDLFEQMQDMKSGVRFQTKASIDPVQEAMKELKFEGEYWNLPDEDFKKFIKKRDSIINKLRDKEDKEILKTQTPDSFLRNVGDRPVSTQGVDTGMLVRERFKIDALKKLGTGSDRVVYELGDNKVLKIVKSARDLEQTAQGLDYYLQGEGIIPNVFESGKNYTVTERLKPFKELGKEDRKIMNDFIKDMSEVQDLVNKKDMGAVHEKLSIYGWEALADFDLDKFGWGDIRKANLSIKDGKPVLIDEGTLNLTDTIKNYTGVRNLDDPDFRRIYDESKALKKEFGDTDKNTMFQKSEIIGQGEDILQADAKKVVEKYFNADEVGVEFVNKISTPEGLEALGKYREGLITFSKNPLESTPEHEVLHAFFDMMTPEDRKVKVLSEIKDKQKFDNDLDAEEWLADNFVNFARARDVSGITENVKQFFEDMLRGLKTVFVEGDIVDNLYRDLEALTKKNGISKPKAVVIGGVTDEEED